MRIISGMHKGRRLSAPKKLPVRPTTDMAKEGLFNILNNSYHFSELSVLDLFAGTGNISFEFASRGTKHITAVDKHYACINYISKITEELDFSIQTIKSDVYAFLEKQAGTYDLIFADPPYNFTIEAFNELIALIFKNSLLNKNGVLIVEHSKHTILEDNSNYIRSRKYGGSVFSFFELGSEIG